MANCLLSETGDYLLQEDGSSLFCLEEGFDVFDGKLVIKSSATGVFDGKLFVCVVVTDLLDGKIHVILSDTDSLDGYVVVKNIYPAYCAWKDIPPAPQWFLPPTIPRKTIYIAVLRADGYDDVIVPMSSLQLRRRDGNPTYVMAVVPDADTYLADAEDRQDGELIVFGGIEYEDGTQVLTELDRAVLESIFYDIGVHSSSLSLSGYKTTSNTNPRPVVLSGVSYEGLQADGKRRIRSTVNAFLRPGDTVVWSNGDSFTVEQIYIKIDTTNSWMEVSGI